MKFGNPRIPTELSALRKLNARAGARTLNLGLGQPEIDMPEALRELAVRALRTHRLGYTPNAGRPELREAVAGFYGLKAEGVVVSHGAQEGLMAILLALLDKGDEVLLPDPGFLAYPTMVKIAGGESRFYSLRGRNGAFTYGAEAILAGLTRRTKAVLVCSPNNPTGTILPESERARLLAELSRRKIFLISDDVYGELCFAGSYRPASSFSPYAVTVSSWSKSLALTGWRIGFVHNSHPRLAPKVLAAHQYLTTCASAPAQALVLEALRDRALYEKVLGDFRALYRGRMERFRACFAGEARPVMPEGGFYLWLRAAKRSDRQCAEDLLQNRDLLVVPGSYFGKEGRGFLRVSVAAPEASLEQAGKILGGLLP